MKNGLGEIARKTGTFVMRYMGYSITMSAPSRRHRRCTGIGTILTSLRR
jgi:hypothetical protein